MATLHEVSSRPRRQLATFRRLSAGVSIVLTATATLGACASDDDDAGSAGQHGLDDTGETLCNGNADLCDRAYNDVVYPATHNAHSTLFADFAGAIANQTHSIAQQLEDGVRCMALDVYEHEGDTALCHGPCSLGATPHRDALGDIKSFLEANPRDVFTIIYEDHISAEVIEDDFKETGLVDFVFTHAEGDGWPTLQEMIDDGTRLVITAESVGPPPAWLHHVWDVAWDTNYSFKSPDEFSCALNRGSEGNDLFLLNHWVGTAAGLPSIENSKLVNQSETLLTRAQQCQDESGQLPNYIMVDFYEHGDLFAVVDTMNGF